MFGGWRFVKIVSEYGDMRDILQTGHTDRKRLYEYMTKYKENIENNLEDLKSLNLETKIESKNEYRERILSGDEGSI